LNTSSAAPLDIRFATTNAVAFVVKPAPLADILDYLQKRLGPTPGVYYAETAILDLSAWSLDHIMEHKLNLNAFKTAFSKAGINWVEVRGTLPSLEEEAENLGIKFEKPNPETGVNTPNDNVESPSAHSSPVQEAAAAPNTSTETATRKTMLVEQSVRSGQRIYAQGADLIVTGQVSAGAEVIADGNVHVYGVLRGRALAGAAGDTQARIYSTCFEPELVAVAGYYLTFDGGFPEENRSKPSLIYLDQGLQPAALRLKSLNIR
jgi:septum site-determining protein MinC